MEGMLIVVTLLSLAAAGLSGVMAWRARADERRRAAARVESLGTAIDAALAPFRTSPPIAIDGLFARAEASRIRSRPAIRAAAAGFMTLLLLAAIAFHELRGAGPANLAASAETPLLELLVMHHAREGAALKVSGIVRNISTGPAVDHVAAGVLAFDSTGALMTSNRAPLDLVTLPAGTETPFEVTLPVADGVARYRVTFRSPSGVIRHIDRRG